MLKIGLFGGTFNPIHFGHIALAKSAFEKLNLDKVLFIPSGNPPHKENDFILNYHDRCRLAEESLKEYENFFISFLDDPRYGKSYTLKQAERAKKLYPDAELYFLIGEDNVPKLQTWFKIEELFNLVFFVVFSRENTESFNREELPYLHKLKFISMPKVNISSSQIRKYISEDKYVDCLVPAPVKEFILKKNIFKIT